jgi:hypothetical protein
MLIMISEVVSRQHYSVLFSFEFMLLHPHIDTINHIPTHTNLQVLFGFNASKRGIIVTAHISSIFCVVPPSPVRI